MQLNESYWMSRFAGFDTKGGKFRPTWNRTAVSFLSFAVVIIGFTLGMGGNMAKTASSSLPAGVLYFSNGASIEKLNLKTRKRKEIVPWLDQEGKYESNSTFPVYSSKEKKMYFFRSYVWPVKYELVTFDLEKQNEERLQTLDRRIEALSLLMNSGLLTFGGGIC